MNTDLQISALGLVDISNITKSKYVVNYVNDSLFTDNILSLVDKPDFNIKCGQSNAFTFENRIYLLSGEIDNIVYYIVCKDGYPVRLLTKCIEDMKNYYNGYKKVNKKMTSGLLKSICDRYNNPAEIDKLTKVQQKVNSVKSVMQENIEIALQNCVKLDTLERQAEELAQASNIFKDTTRKLRSKLWWKNMQMRIIIGLIIFVILGIIIGITVGISQQDSNSSK